MRGPGVEDFTRRVRDLVLLASSSRGGSSMLASMLRQSPSLLHLQAEINPFLRLAGLAYPDSAQSDQLDAGHLAGLSPQRRQDLDRDLALDAGNPATMVDDEQFVLDVIWRFTVQWPEIAADLDELAEMASRGLARARARNGWGPGEIRDPAEFHAEFLGELCAEGVPVSPRYYDLPAGIAARLPAIGQHGSAPGRLLIEEPPFVITPGWRRATASDLDRPLVIKTPSNAYRFGFLRALFPNARIRVVHLLRNPAASVNGLYDGWRYHGFHAHRMPEPLRLKGYGDRFPDDRWWWKFDFPPGWERFTDATLLQVCAFQWRSCHSAILANAPRTDYMRLRFEDLIRSAESRQARLAELSEWLGVPFDDGLRRVARDGIPPVVATTPPTPRRWRARQEAVRQVIDHDVREVAAELGYEADACWI
jgi:hypothetical protein